MTDLVHFVARWDADRRMSIESTTGLPHYVMVAMCGERSQPFRWVTDLVTKPFTNDEAKITCDSCRRALQATQAGEVLADIRKELP